jgi:hypothetical protein
LLAGVGGAEEVLDVDTFLADVFLDFLLFDEASDSEPVSTASGAALRALEPTLLDGSVLAWRFWSLGTSSADGDLFKAAAVLLGDTMVLELTTLAEAERARPTESETAGDIEAEGANLRRGRFEDASSPTWSIAITLGAGSSVGVLSSLDDARESDISPDSLLLPFELNSSEESPNPGRGTRLVGDGGPPRMVAAFFGDVLRSGESGSSDTVVVEADAEESKCCEALLEFAAFCR